MKCTIIALSAICILNSQAFASDPGSERSISVTGTVSTSTAPDHIVWRISLKDTDKNLQLAKQFSEEKVKAILKLRGPLGLNEGDLETGPLYVNREYERNQHGYQGAFKHFVITRSIVIRQHDLTQFDQFLDRLVSSAEMEVSFSFASSKIYEVRAETRLKAVEEAKKKAQQMARIVGAELGHVITINEHPLHGAERHFMSNSNGAFAGTVVNPDVASDRFVPGSINVQVTVYLTFALE